MPGSFPDLPPGAMGLERWSTAAAASGAGVRGGGSDTWEGRGPSVLIHTFSLSLSLCPQEILSWVKPKRNPPSFYGGDGVPCQLQTDPTLPLWKT